MNLVTLGIYTVALTAVLGGLIALLPSASEWPYPVQVAVGLTLIFDAIRAFDQILPISELINCTQYMVWILLFTRIVWPSAMWIFRSIPRP